MHFIFFFIHLPVFWLNSYFLKKLAMLSSQLSLNWIFSFFSSDDVHNVMIILWNKLQIKLNRPSAFQVWILKLSIINRDRWWWLMVMISHFFNIFCLIVRIKCVEYFMKTKSELARYSNKQTEIVIDRFLSFVVRQ